MLFGILGPLEARSADGPVALGGPRPRSLLALLLLEAGHVVPTDRLIDGLYGEDPPGDAANALQGQVSRLRRALGSGAPIEFHPAGYRLVVDPDDVDAHRFQHLAAAGRQALEAGDARAASDVLREALALWRGPALADVTVASGQAARLEEQRLAAIEDRVAADLQLGEGASLVPELRELVSAFPLRERLRGHLMRALYAAGRQAEALSVYEDARRLLADELGTDPSPELAEVHLAVLRGETAHRQALPAQLTSFVGRDAELARIASLFEGYEGSFPSADRLESSPHSTRLVTLTGPGGAGKTRLAIEAATRDLRESCFVDLAPVRSAVPQAVLGALGLRESALPQDPLQRLVAALSDRKVLLVLDNCEHLVDEVARLVFDLLAACPDLRVLTTSREALGITGESLCAVPPLAPEPSVRLFADRAAAVRPGLVVDDSVHRVCAALDGLPLAIELAAARLRTLTPAELESRLDDRFRLLSRGPRTVAPRHQTLRAVVEWSWDLLSPEEQDLAARLSVFAGGATLSSAEAVSDSGDVLDLLAGLVDKSFVEVTDGRYRMLETIRAFCAERLVDADSVARRHASYFLSLAAAADQHLRKSTQLEWLDRLHAEHANLRAALHWAVSAAPDLAADLFRELSWYWYLRGVRTEVVPLAVRLLESLEPAPTEEYLIVAAYGAPDRVMGLLPQLTGPIRQPFVLVAWAMLAGPPKADAPEIALKAEIESSSDPWLQGLLGFSTGYTSWLIHGDREYAQRACLEALEKFRSIGERWGMAQGLDALANIATDPAEALALTDEALTVVTELGASEELAELRCRRADRLVLLGDLVAAQRDYELALELARRAGLAATRALAHAGLGELARRRGDLGEARRLLEQAVLETGPGWMHDAARDQVDAALRRLAEDERPVRPPG
ncbi:SARP family transcriptional regulator [Lentzea sp. NBRC 105346]|uniref:BTAD domain-containing putative transcriptional regulator n=1 Tax=Lentzea sp. NBRC 105346 TaxID=3032205 RepID=UPI0024A33977|nr:BTAD domain-containing putative transcriptional regulator [Lentzea sp. NBRC 105346]GLZ30026.1 SARP family transcriptional regulator [Lentzea sp. NBRC 105346]